VLGDHESLDLDELRQLYGGKFAEHAEKGKVCKDLDELAQLNAMVSRFEAAAATLAMATYMLKITSVEGTLLWAYALAFTEWLEYCMPEVAVSE